MKPINECLADATPIESLTLEAAERVARAFCLQFYITASEDRSTITKYYGHESKFYLNDQTITGPQKIAESYNHLPERARFKINSVKGYPTLHSQGIIINVIGSVNFRPFVQSFLLGQQKQKTYYIESDAFQYVDNYFDFKLEQGCSLPVGLVEHPDSLNHNPTISKKYPEQSMTQPMSTMQMQQTPKKAKELPSPVEQDTSNVAEQDNSQKPKDVQHQPEQQQQPVAAPVLIPEVVQEQPKIPKTWASLVGGNNKQQSSQQPKYTQGRQTNQQHQMQATTPHQHQQMHPTQTYQQQRHPQQASQHPSKDFRQSQSNSDTSQNERKIYLGGITREIVPSNTAQAETEIKQVFYKYGQVEEVRMPRKVLDSPNDTSKHAFAFITMRNKAGVQSIFAAATRDEQGVWTLPLKLDAFGFDGYAQISEQRNQPLGGGTRGGRGGFQSRGNVSRGSPGGASYVFQKVLGSKMAANSREPTLSSSLTFM